MYYRQNDDEQSFGRNSKSWSQLVNKQSGLPPRELISLQCTKGKSFGRLHKYKACVTEEEKALAQPNPPNKINGKGMLRYPKPGKRKLSKKKSFG